jgi:cysteine synthase A
MEAFNGRVLVDSWRDPVDGLLGALLRYVRLLYASDNHDIKLNQYTGDANWQAHYRRTVPVIAARSPRRDVLFCGAGRRGTLMRGARCFRWWPPVVRVVAWTCWVR